MKTDILSTILIFGGLLLVEGLYTGISQPRNWANDTRRIIHGYPANPADFQFLVQLRIDPVSLCGGSIIHSYYILSAAHCMDGGLCAGLRIYPSTHTGGDAPSIPVSHCYTHALYNPMLFWNDIGLVRTSENLVTFWQLEVIPIAPPDTHFFEGMPAIIVGWGETDQPLFSNDLNRADVVVASWDLCNIEFQNANECFGGGQCPVPELPITDFCTIGISVVAPGPCKGDLGGPVIINNMLAAVMSGGISVNHKCAGGTPSVHVLVAPYLKWIHFIINLPRKHEILRAVH